MLGDRIGELTGQITGRRILAPTPTPQAEISFQGEGGEMATWRGNGVGVPTGDGLGAKWRGAIYPSTTAADRAKLNETAVVYESEVAPEGAVSAITFAWE